MPARLRSLTITALAAAVPLLTTPAVSTARSSQRLAGINIGGVYAGERPATIAREIAAARSMHATVVRVEMPWSAFEPVAESQIDERTVAAADRVMADARHAGITVIASVDSTPCWATTAPQPLRARCGTPEGGAAHAWPPSDPSAYGRFTAWLARRYAAHLAAIEVWNEPDQANQDYLAGPNKAREDAKLLRAAYPAIKAAAPNVKVLAGSLVGPNGAFMKALYKEGIKGYYDGVAVHFYTLVLASLRVFREVQLANGDHAPLWLDEFGWSSCWPQRIQEEQGCVNRRTQATDITNVFRELAHTHWVAAETIYKLADSRYEDFGMLGARGAPKPSFYALSKVLKAPFGPLSPITLRLRAQHGRVVASGSGPVGDYMKMEAYRGGRLRYTATFALNRFNRYAIALPKALGSHVTVRVYQYWLGAGHAARRSI